MYPPSGLSFIVSHINFSGDLPVEISGGHFLRKASFSEIGHIDRLISQNLPHGLPFNWVPYKATVSETKDGTSTKYFLKDLPQEEWKYWVIAFNGNGKKAHEIERMSTLLRPDLEFGFQIYFDEIDQKGNICGYSHLSPHILERFSNSATIWKNAEEMDTREIQKVSHLIEMFEGLSGEYSFINHAMDNLFALRRLPMNAEILIVAYFSIIESLVTHAPRLAETLDSINHQIQNKMILVGKRFEFRVEYSDYFGSAAADTIWKMLYGYRSCLAHGTKTDFNSKYKVLKNFEMVSRFLKENIKQLIQLSVNEPEFISDLRKC